MPPPPPPPEPWTRALEATPEGRIWLANLAVDVRSGNLPRPVYDALLDALTALTPEAAPGPFRLAADATALLVADAVAAVSEAPDTFCMSSPRAPHPEPLARVMDAASFGLYHVVPGLGEPTSDGTGARTAAALGRTILPRHYHGLMRTGRPYFWATPADALGAHQPAGPDAVRDLLGLGHVPAATWLVAVHIPTEAAAAATLAAPTTLDAGDSPWFAPWPGHDLDPYGRTRHLQTRDPALPEVLVSPVALDARFRVESVGQTSDPVGADLGPWVADAEARAAEWDAPP